MPPQIVDLLLLLNIGLCYWFSKLKPSLGLCAVNILVFAISTLSLLAQSQVGLIHFLPWLILIGVLHLAAWIDLNFPKE